MLRSGDRTAPSELFIHAKSAFDRAEWEGFEASCPGATKLVGVQIVDAYDDAAAGTLARDADGRMAMTLVTLRPAVRFGGERRPDAAEIERLHHAAHDECYIANSVKTAVRCEPVFLA